MAWSSVELAEVRDMVGALLEALGLDAYLFEIEPRDGDWKLRVDCAVDEGWQSFRLTLDPRRVVAAREDGAVRNRLLAELGETLGGCKRRD